MTEAHAQPYVRFEDFLAAELASEVKHEWLDGVVYAMAGGTIQHARLATKVSAALTVKLAGRCTVLSSDAMVYLRETQLATYPDVTVVCGAMDIGRAVRNDKVLGEPVTNPTLVVEVLSEATESYDRGEKFAHYLRASSLKEYVLVSQAERRVEVFRRPAGRGHWEHEVARAGDEVTLLGERLRVDAIYAD